MPGGGAHLYAVEVEEYLPEEGEEEEEEEEDTYIDKPKSSL